MAGKPDPQGVCACLVVQAPRRGRHESGRGVPAARLLARTNPDVPKHRGISYLIVDMRTPGITVCPLRQMSGASEFNEVFFDDVVVPTSCLLGEQDKGWSVAPLLI